MTSPKICVGCGVDVSAMQRSKDRQGNYFCPSCWQSRNGAQRSSNRIHTCAVCSQQISGDHVHVRGGSYFCKTCHALAANRTAIKPVLGDVAFEYSESESTDAAITPRGVNPPPLDLNPNQFQEHQRSNSAPPTSDAKLLVGVFSGAILLLLGFLIWFFVYRDYWESNHRQAILQLNSDANALVAAGNLMDGYRKYEELIQLVGNHKLSTSDVIRTVDHAREARERANQFVSPYSEAQDAINSKDWQTAANKYREAIQFGDQHSMIHSKEYSNCQNGLSVAISELTKISERKAKEDQLRAGAETAKIRLEREKAAEAANQERRKKQLASVLAKFEIYYSQVYGRIFRDLSSLDEVENRNHQPLDEAFVSRYFTALKAVSEAEIDRLNHTPTISDEEKSAMGESFNELVACDAALATRLKCCENFHLLATSILIEAIRPNGIWHGREADALSLVSELQSNADKLEKDAALQHGACLSQIYRSELHGWKDRINSEGLSIDDVAIAAAAVQETQKIQAAIAKAEGEASDPESFKALAKMAGASVDRASESLLLYQRSLDAEAGGDDAGAERLAKLSKEKQVEAADIARQVSEGFSRLNPDMQKTFLQLLDGFSARQDVPQQQSQLMSALSEGLNSRATTAEVSVKSKGMQNDSSASSQLNGSGRVAHHADVSTDAPNSARRSGEEKLRQGQKAARDAKFPDWKGPWKICPMCNGTGRDAYAERQENDRRASIHASNTIGTGLSGPAGFPMAVIRCDVCGGTGEVPDSGH